MKMRLELVELRFTLELTTCLEIFAHNEAMQMKACIRLVERYE